MIPAAEAQVVDKRELRVGIAGLGMAAAGIIRTLLRVPGITIVAAADPRENARAKFAADFSGRPYGDVSQLVEDRSVDVIWVATPTQMHHDHAVLAAEHGKAVVVEKPFASSLADAEAMVRAAEVNSVAMIAGGSRSFDPAFAAMLGILESGRLGRLGALNSWSFGNWMLRPRVPYEVDTSTGGGAIFNQAPHVIDVLRLLGGGLVTSVRAATGEWMPERPCPGYFTALLEFASGVPATLSYNGYGYLCVWEFVPWGESDQRREAAMSSLQYRARLRCGEVEEADEKEQYRYGGGSKTNGVGDGRWVPQDAGLVVASCENGELRQSAHGIFVYDDHGRHDEPIQLGASTRANEVAELRNAMNDLPVIHDARWGMATLEVVIALQRSAQSHIEIPLEHQVSSAARARS